MSIQKCLSGTNEAPLGLLFHIMEGEVVWVRPGEKEALTDLIEDVWRRYLDYKPFLGKMLLDLDG